MTNYPLAALLCAVAACDGTLDVQTRTAELQTATCTHGVCVAGSPLASSCTSCTATVCLYDPFCCDMAWDAVCVGEADSLCGNICQTSCTGGDVPIVDFADWDKQLPLPLGREVLVIGPWLSPDLMSVTVFQQQTDEAVLIVGGVPGLGPFFTSVVISPDIGIVGASGGPGKTPCGPPIGPPGLYCVREIIQAGTELARGFLRLPLVCDLEPVEQPAM